MAIGTALAIGGASALAGGILNHIENMSAADRAAALRDQGLQEWIKLQIPNPKDQQIALERFVNQGQLVPVLEQAVQQQPSEFLKISSGASEKAAQSRALSELQNIGFQGGLRLQDKAALQEAELNSTAKARGDRQAIVADMARRGAGNSGFALQNQIAAQQGDADRNARSSLSVAAQAQDRALQSLVSAGDLGTKIRGQNFSEQSAKAQAQDAINRFNTGNLQDVQNRNVALQNRDQETNLREQQRISDQNTGLANQQQQYNKGLAQQQFENQARVAQGKAALYGGQAQGEIQRGQQAGNFWTNLGSGVTNTAAAVNNAQQSKDDRDFWEKYFAGQNKSQPVIG